MSQSGQKCRKRQKGLVGPFDVFDIFDAFDVSIRDKYIRTILNGSWTRIHVLPQGK